LSASFDYWPEIGNNKQTYLNEDELETFEYWFLWLLESSNLELSIFFL
jgi:hypothetical protein